MVGWGEHKVVLDESGFSAYRVDVDWGLNFLPSTLVVATWANEEGHADMLFWSEKRKAFSKIPQKSFF